ncbi:MAG TPA: tetratricopeptide repeat protein [Chitinophagaceae bacterium]|nr:tetratricopeptide repeat protein [Chitinophagaceae bacterium]
MKVLLLLLAMFCSWEQVYAQLQGQRLIDSLITQLPKAKEDTNRVMLLNDLSLTYYSIDPDEGVKYGNQGLALAEKLKWKRGMAYAYKVLAGNYGYGKSDYAQALEYSTMSLQIFREIGDRKGTAKILGDIGVLYWFQSDYPNALKYFFDALKIHEELGIKNEIAATLANIGLVYNSHEDYHKALEYLIRANKIDEELGNKNGVAANLGNIGELYMNISDTAKALAYDLKSLEMYEELGDKNGIARNLANLGNIYATKGEYGKALDYYSRSLKLHEELGHQMGIASDLGNIGSTYLEMAKDNRTGSKELSYQVLPRQRTVALQQAKLNTSRAIDMFLEIGDLYKLSLNYQRLSEIQTLLGDDKNALASFKSYTLYKDSIYNTEKDKKLTETALRYEFEKKEAMTKAEQEKKDIIQRNIRNSFIAGAVLLLLLLIAVGNRYLYKQKANQKLATAYENLKATQDQLVESEKLAAFGVMASRMAHEIQNPLNFVNNFSAISTDLVEDILSSDDEADKRETADVLVSNLEKINFHGKRAADIINQLQNHARAGTAQKFFEEEKN